MSGYIFNLDSPDALRGACVSGCFGTRIRAQTRDVWHNAYEATFADYCSMRPGEHVYFFSERRLYGIGELTPIDGGPAFLNFPGASSPRPAVPTTTLIPNTAGPAGIDSIRWICLFRPSPFWFRNGVDMDDALSSRPSAFRMLRAFWRRSFIKIDDAEDGALGDAIRLANRAAIEGRDPAAVFDDDSAASHQRIQLVLTPEHRLGADDIWRPVTSAGRIRHEMALEAGLVQQLTKRDDRTVAVFGDWDFIAHQVFASPAKPPDYGDWMDIFGYRRLRGFETIGDFCVAELKSGIASANDVEQLMKYVDWLAASYAFGDYSRVRAWLVASAFEPATDDAIRDHAQRAQTVGRRPARTVRWGLRGEFARVRYEPDEAAGLIRFHLV